ncbi:hypothetical protein R3P38DRAFT_3371274, partial [Favolaschia claudopus]
MNLVTIVHENDAKPSPGALYHQEANQEMSSSNKIPSFHEIFDPLRKVATVGSENPTLLGVDWHPAAELADPSEDCFHTICSELFPTKPVGLLRQTGWQDAIFYPGPEHRSSSWPRYLRLLPMVLALEAHPLCSGRLQYTWRWKKEK